ncbi:MAG: hypothetical protein AB1925_13165 [Actinomycetota bacterium]
MDLTSLVRGSLRTVEAVVGEVMPVVLGVERVVVGVIKQHLEQLDDAGPEDDPGGIEVASAPPGEVLQSLLDRAIYNSPEDSRRELYTKLLDALLPDEARIIAALADGTVYPLVHIAEPIAGGNSAPVLENASTVGRAAGLSLPNRTPLYLTRLVRLGLISFGAEGPESMNEEYEMLLTDDAVTVAQAKARRGPIGAKVIRRTVRISALGQELWEASK